MLKSNMALFLRIYKKLLYVYKIKKYSFLKIEKFIFESDHKYLIVAPHPDDEVLYTFGVMNSSPENVTVLCLTSGGLENIRAVEFLNVMKFLKINNYHHFEYVDGQLVCKKNIDFSYSGFTHIFIPNPINTHPDHAFFGYYLLKLYRAKKLEKFVKIVFYEDNGSLQFPTHYIDISNSFSIKINSLSLYKSQLEKKFDFISYITSLNRFRGILSGTLYSECYTVINASELEYFINRE